ncbi:hypothetical protein, conserved [Babesia ovata]|uniref:Uncharacterized protein n=1 Tax=Babesia ovata TaxID=189622 RepID=A0A2H6KDJ9_9APIC|nr:uncharacterized protein BOVATA_025220 [Babesia ovata]GBE61029.1 hypothetical protein, conserved [Babesia ovata]
MSTTPSKLLPVASDRWAGLCGEFIEKLLNLGVETGAIIATKNPNRVDLKKGLLNATRGRSLTHFVRYLGPTEKQHLKAMIHMECPVICPNRKVMLPPVESMPSNVMKSAKKLRNFFGVPEAQICRGCVKRVRCRRYQQVERDLPDLSDITAVLIGVYSTCKIYMQGSDLVVPQSSLKELSSVSSVVDSLSSFLQASPQRVDHEQVDGENAKRLVQKHAKLKEAKRLEMLKEKVFNMPAGFGAMPSAETYMASFQRDLYNKLNKNNAKGKEDDSLWVEDHGDTTLDHDEGADLLEGLHKLNAAKKAVTRVTRFPDVSLPEHVHQLHPSSTHFRMDYEAPIGTDVDLLRYDMVNDKFIQGVKVNAKGRVVVDLDTHVPATGSDDTDLAPGIESYRAVTAQKAGNYSSLLNNIRSNLVGLPFLKKVQYNYQCQSSGGKDNLGRGSNQDEESTLSDLAVALNSHES